MNVKKKAVTKAELLKKRKKESVEQSEKNSPVNEIKVPQHVGHQFRKIRERKHYKIEEVSEVLRIGGRYLEAIEEGNTELLPERVYTLGFVRAYAQFLGEKPSKCVELFKQQILLENQSVQLNLPEALRKSTAPNRLYLLVSVGVVVSVLLFWLIMNSISKEKHEILDSTPSDKTFMRSEKLDPAQAQFQKDLPEKPVEETSLSTASIISKPIEDDKTAENLIPQNNVKAASKNIEKEENKIPEKLVGEIPTVKKNAQIATSIKLSCTEETWVQIRNTQGEIIFVKTMMPGDTFDVPQKEGLLLFTGNAGGINVSIGDNPPKPLGRKGEVKQHILLDDQSLLSYLNAR
ncbi:hypothetical protein IM40_04630 [Candidatus Paracaedimonas acanthamoebae]|nr:hypothetical protein IM40_04630 [Candidatus Paracaedimonas acanthamoebae]